MLALIKPPFPSWLRGPLWPVGAVHWVALPGEFLLKFFETNRLTPFGIYCIVFGTFCTLVFALGG